MAGRMQPRKPEWLLSAPTEPQRPGSDNTARVLEFPCSVGPGKTVGGSTSDGWAPGTASDLRLLGGGSVGGSSSGSLRTTLLSPEPAYKSVLGRLSRQGLTDSVRGVRLEEQASLPIQLDLRPPPKPATVAPPAEPAGRESGSTHPRPAPIPLNQQPPSELGGRQLGSEAHPAAEPTLQGVPPLPQSAGGPSLQLQLKDRIERAKAEIKQQLSPLFRVSQALAGQSSTLGHSDLQQAAQALDNAAASSRRLQLLSLRPGSSSSSYGQDAVQIPAAWPGLGGQGAAAAAAPDALGSRGRQGLQLPPRQGAVVRDNPLFGLHAGRDEQEPPGSPGRDPAEEVDSLVLSARAAMSKAQSTIEDLASPPRLSPASAQPGQGSGVASAAAAAAAAAGPAPHQPYRDLGVQVGGSLDEYHQLEQQQQQQHVGTGRHPTDQLQPQPQQPPLPHAGALAAASLVLAPTLAALPLPPLPPGGGATAADLEGQVAQLRQHSEVMIRHECDKLVAAMHAMYDQFLRGVQQNGLLVRVSVGGGGTSLSRAEAGAGAGAAISGGGLAAAPQASWSNERLQALAATPQQQPEQQQQQQQQQQGGQPGPGIGAVQQRAVQGQAAAEAARDVSQGAPLEEPSSSLGSECCGMPTAESSENQQPNLAFEFPQRQPASCPPEQEATAGGWLQRGVLAGDGQAGIGQIGDAGFGSPIKVPGSHQASPARGFGQRPTLQPSAGLLAAQGQPGGAAQRLFGAAAAPGTAAVPSPGNSGPATTAGGARPSRLGPDHPAISRLQGESFITARSSLADLGGTPSALRSSARVAPPAGAATPASSLAQGPLAAGATGAPAGSARRDLDSIVTSIRRLAAETKLKHSLRPLPGSSLLQQRAPPPRRASTSTAAGSQGSLAGLHAQTSPGSSSRSSAPLSQLAARQGGEGPASTGGGQGQSSGRRYSLQL